MKQLRYEFLLCHLAALEHAAQEASFIANQLNLTDNARPNSFAARQHEILNDLLSLNARLARRIATDLPQLMEASYE